MSIQALFEKPGEGRMYVPADKVQAFIANGWTMMQPGEPPESDGVVTITTPESETPELEQVMSSQAKTKKAKKPS